MEKSNDIAEIFTSYLEEERKIEQRLHECGNKRYGLKMKNPSKSYQLAFSNAFFKTPEECRQRNQRIIRDLEISKGKLRSVATFDPTDEELFHVAEEYRKFLQSK